LPVRFDDFEYQFNFDALFPGELTARRIAQQSTKLEADQEYTFVLTGALANPEPTIWETGVREFADADTVFEVRFGHLAASLGELDVYFAAPGVAPVAGGSVGTIGFQEVLPPADFAAGSFVLTLTPAGDPATILYQSASTPYAEKGSNIISVFDGDEMDTAAYIARGVTLAGAETNLPDVRFPPTVRFVQTSMDLPTSDIYKDEMLSSLVLANHAFADASGDLPVSDDETEFRYTAAGNPGAILFEETFEPPAGSHSNFLVYGDDSDRKALQYRPDRRSVSTFAKVQLFQGATNHDRLDVYFVTAGNPLSDVVPRIAMPFGSLSEPLQQAAGNYDIYLTPVAEKTVIAGPVSIELELGDSVEILILDTVDPASATISVLPPP
jgi:hypothetical protein